MLEKKRVIHDFSNEANFVQQRGALQFVTLGQISPVQFMRRWQDRQAEAA